MKIAIFADLHGKILLSYILVDLYQKKTGKNIDLILQCGDLGLFPNIEKLDKATLKHAKYDRDEFGFSEDFIKVNPEMQSFLEKLNLQMICVRGNHEDHDFLNELENEFKEATRFPVDVYKKVFICKSGWVQEFMTKSEHLTFVGIGRVGDRKGRNEKRFIQVYERQQIKNLLKTKDYFDILITHDRDDSSQLGFGMTEIREVLDNVIFLYHFYGHTGEPFNQATVSNGITNSIKIKELEFDDNGFLP
ncbi:MAG: metallophosphoesterase [Bacteroidota bacterium]